MKHIFKIIIFYKLYKRYNTQKVNTIIIYEVYYYNIIIKNWIYFFVVCINYMCVFYENNFAQYHSPYENYQKS
jgi:hypothetical protein